MMFFGLSFIPYFFKLSAGYGFWSNNRRPSQSDMKMLNTCEGDYRFELRSSVKVTEAVDSLMKCNGST